MKNKPIYIIVGIVVLLAAVLLFVGGSRKKQSVEQSTDMSWSTFSSKDKKAGGAYAAFKLLPQLFAYHAVQVVTKSFARTYSKEKELAHNGNVYILVSDNMFTTEKDIDAMLQYVAPGNELFIAVNNPDPVLAQQLKFAVTESSSFQQQQVGWVQRYTDASVPLDTSFTYKGMVAGNYFSSIDSSITTVLGTNYKNKPNFIRVAYSRGYIYLLLNPYTFTNYFLLHQQNVNALETQLSYLKDYADNVYWDDFYSHQHSAQSGDFSEWQVLMRYPAMRWALWLSILLLLLYVVFESKRRQRIIPDKPALNNTSLEFVDAIGQLYYQRHDNHNLAHKMIVHLLEYIRSRYYMDTNVLNEEFVTTLSKKSAIAESDIRLLLQMISHIQLEQHVSDEYLQEFYKRIQLFYLNTK
ncbi:DUF4350 domain-containing protein [Chitinophaga eiseniae]|uniref:DUF4350 domain-containing protein n=1 Tax=Chitinophaga eiseniae TaxID=634771 RepID=A0A847SNN8_9BACT|nr:DUF4350 domain-containing protein [Chitinophaga eiseniae]NLR81854.1 DUF4350 domain-containing protein [Chitinophaga eiseniae]